MEQILILINILITYSSVCCQSTDWCSTTSNCNKNQHISCNNNGTFSLTCNNPKAILLNEAQKKMLVDKHNEYRNKVASGNLDGFSTARRMAKLGWNDQLARFAELNTKQCKMQHDACHNTRQNLAVMMTTAIYSVENVIEGSLAMWFNEYKDATMNNINKVGTSSKGVIGHFTAMVIDRSTLIGCGMSSYRTSQGSTWFNAYLLACNYASTNIFGCSVYKTGPTASSCINGPDPTYKGLCKSNEPIDPNSLC